MPFLLIHWPGHFLLTNLLLDKMKATARVSGIEGRIVNLSSVAHLHTYEEGIRFDKINDQLGYANYLLMFLLPIAIGSTCYSIHIWGFFFFSIQLF